MTLAPSVLVRKRCFFIEKLKSNYSMFNGHFRWSAPSLSFGPSSSVECKQPHTNKYSREWEAQHITRLEYQSIRDLFVWSGRWERVFLAFHCGCGCCCCNAWPVREKTHDKVSRHQSYCNGLLNVSLHEVFLLLFFVQKSWNIFLCRWKRQRRRRRRKTFTKPYRKMC